MNLRIKLTIGITIAALSLLCVFFIVRRQQTRKRRMSQLPRIHTSLRRLVADFHSLCGTHGIEYWADSGTLLGAVRNGSIILHDDDVDVCITKEGLSILRKVVANNPASLYIQLGWLPGMVHKLKRKDDPDVWIDLFVVSDQGKGHVVRYSEKVHRMIWPAYWYAKHELYPLRQVPFDNTHIMIPQFPIPYLERAYGSTWRIPKVWKLHV